MERVRHLSHSKSAPSFVRRTPLFFGAVRFQETVFALPFAYSGMVLAADGLPTLHQFVWITVAMMAARTLGMAANRFIDRNIDARNPRTAERHLPAGRLRASDMALLAGVSAAVLFVAATQLNPLALALSPVAAVYLVFYPFAKRFMWAASFFLGWALAIAPSAAWVGVRGTLGWEPVLLSLAVASWASSFDIMYHAQDRAFYLRAGYHSVAARFGVLAAFRWSRTLDVLAVACLFGLGVWMELAYPYYIGCGVAAVLLGIRYRMVSPEDLSRMGVAFMRINAFVSTVVFVGVLTAVSMSG